MLTISQVSKQVGCSKQTVRNHLARLGLWESIQHGEKGTALLTAEQASQIASSIMAKKTPGAGGRPPKDNPSAKTESPQPDQALIWELGTEARASALSADARAEAAEAEARSAHAELLNAMGEIARLSASEAEARERARASEARAATLKSDIVKLHAVLDGVREASLWQRLRGFAGLLPSKTGESKEG